MCTGFTDLALSFGPLPPHAARIQPENKRQRTAVGDAAHATLVADGLWLVVMSSPFMLLLPTYASLFCMLSHACPNPYVSPSFLMPVGPAVLCAWLPAPLASTRGRDGGRGGAITWGAGATTNILNIVVPNYTCPRACRLVVCSCSVARVAAFPIGIDPERFGQALETEEVQMNIAKLLNRYAGRKVRHSTSSASLGLFRPALHPPLLPPPPHTHPTTTTTTTTTTTPVADEHCKADLQVCRAQGEAGS